MCRSLDRCSGATAPSGVFGDVEGLLSSTEELRDSSHFNHMLCVSNSTPIMFISCLPVYTRSQTMQNKQQSE